MVRHDYVIDPLKWSLHISFFNAIKIQLVLISNVDKAAAVSICMTMTMTMTTMAAFC